MTDQKDDNFGKVLPNLKITVDKSSESKFLEEVEAENDQNIEHEEIKQCPLIPVSSFSKDEYIDKWRKTLTISNQSEAGGDFESTNEIHFNQTRRYENKKGGFETGPIFSPEADKKIAMRSIRFELDNSEAVTQSKINDLYLSLGVDRQNIISNQMLRLNVIHVRGLNNMKTEDVLNYFEKYPPSHLEWLNDYCCLVVMKDDETAVRALLGLTLPYDEEKESVQFPTAEKKILKVKELLQNNSKQIETTEYKDSDLSEGEIPDTEEDYAEKMDVDEPAVSLQNISNIALPPGRWRIGKQQKNGQALFFRFATKDDKKPKHAQNFSLYYKKYGNPNYGGLKGHISNSLKRKIKNASIRENVRKFSSKPYGSSAFQKSLKFPVKTMRADIEERKIKERLQRNKTDVKSRLGKKFTNTELLELGNGFPNDEDSGSDEPLSVDIKIPKSRFNIWSKQAKDWKAYEDDMSREGKASAHSRLSINYDDLLKQSRQASLESRLFKSRPVETITRSYSDDDEEEKPERYNPFQSERFQQFEFNSNFTDSRSSHKFKRVSDLRSAISKPNDKKINKHRSPLVNPDD